VVVLVCFLVLSASAGYLDLSENGLRSQFIEFMVKYNRVYKTNSEFSQRFAIFSENMRESETLMQANKGSAKFGVGPFIDMSKEEFASRYLMKNYQKAAPAPVATNVPRANLTRFGIPQGPDPNNWDWSSAGVTTPVYNQGQCGSCWAFSATETVESWFALAGGQLTQLSMEQVVDCDTVDQGCNGGNTNTAYQYIQSAGGLDTYASYPYTAGGGQSGQCQFSQGNTVATVSNYQSVSGETGLYQIASASGPVSVCVDASSWQNYQGGVLTSCGSDIDHCVQLTGYYNYNGQGGTPAWNVRNSWSTSWGISGYIQIAIGSDLCAIGDDATIVTAASG